MQLTKTTIISLLLVLSLQSNAITATKEYVDVKDAATLQAATNYTDHATNGNFKAVYDYATAVSNKLDNKFSGYLPTTGGTIAGNLAQGNNTTASGTYSHAEGYNTTASGGYSHAEGYNTTARGDYSHAEGYRAYVSSGHSYAFVWRGLTESGYSYSKGTGTFCIYPEGGANGFYISDKSFTSYFTSDNSTLVSTINEIAPGSSATTKQYALFIIPLNPVASSATFCHVELKATTNNFNGLLFYLESVYNQTASTITVGGETVTLDWARLYVTSSDVFSGYTDVRTWKRVTNTLFSSGSSNYKCRELIILVDTSLMHRTSDKSWCKEANENLSWSYAKKTYSSVELDAGGANQMWRPIMPVRWYANLPSWANQ